MKHWLSILTIYYFFHLQLKTNLINVKHLTGWKEAGA